MLRSKAGMFTENVRRPPHWLQPGAERNSEGSQTLVPRERAHVIALAALDESGADPAAVPPETVPG